MENLNTEEIINGLLQNASTYAEDKECIRKAIRLIKELTEKVEAYRQELGKVRVALNNSNEDNKRLTEEKETLTIKCNAWHLAAERVGEEIQVIKANTVREFAERLLRINQHLIITPREIEQVSKDILGKRKEEN